MCVALLQMEFSAHADGGLNLYLLTLDWPARHPINLIKKIIYCY